MVRLASRRSSTTTKRASFQAEINRNPVNGDLSLAWPTATGHTYQPESSPDAKTWLPLGNAIPGDGSTTTIPLENPTPKTQPALYRVVEMQ